MDVPNCYCHLCISARMIIGNSTIKTLFIKNLISTFIFSYLLFIDISMYSIIIQMLLYQITFISFIVECVLLIGLITSYFS